MSTCARVGCLRASHESGDRRYLPTNVRVQLDGVGTNWGRITFAHITNLVKMGVLGNTVVARNPVGNTHEDIDAIFAILRNHLIDLDVFSPSELDAAIRGALHSYSLPIFIKHVDGTRDYQAHYDPHIDRGLTGFGYSEYTNGYHVFKATPSCELDVAPACAFKKYQVVTTRAPARARARAPSPLTPPCHRACTVRSKTSSLRLRSTGRISRRRGLPSASSGPCQSRSITSGGRAALRSRRSPPASRA